MLRVELYRKLIGHDRGSLTNTRNNLKVPKLSPETSGYASTSETL